MTFIGVFEYRLFYWKLKTENNKKKISIIIH